ncbi:hypothetical protein SCAR479_08741 [Seiridium cardinale]|uniref:Uncharacterized protein n=1 Tax=Seiridium cardinale TaxID=138064 RepID=A0ABR2XM14_9PEZI
MPPPNAAGSRFYHARISELYCFPFLEHSDPLFPKLPDCQYLGLIGTDFKLGRSTSSHYSKTATSSRSGKRSPTPDNSYGDPGRKAIINWIEQPLFRMHLKHDHSLDSRCHKCRQRLKNEEKAKTHRELCQGKNDPIADEPLWMSQIQHEQFLKLNFNNSKVSIKRAWDMICEALWGEAHNPQIPGMYSRLDHRFKQLQRIKESTSKKLGKDESSSKSSDLDTHADSMYYNKPLSATTSGKPPTVDSGIGMGDTSESYVETRYTSVEAASKLGEFHGTSINFWSSSSQAQTYMRPADRASYGNISPPARRVDATTPNGIPEPRASENEIDLHDTPAGNTWDSLCPIFDLYLPPTSGLPGSTPDHTNFIGLEYFDSSMIDLPPDEDGFPVGEDDR